MCTSSTASRATCGASARWSGPTPKCSPPEEHRMFHYYLMLGVRSLRRNPILTGLMVLTLAVGVAASISTLTILHIMAGDPNPGKSSRLITPLLDPGPAKSYTPGKKSPYLNQSTYRDSLNYLAS